MLERYVDRAGLVGQGGWHRLISVCRRLTRGPARGFSFLRDGPLDMRMDPDAGAPAADWVNSAPEAELVRVIREYGEERFATRIARAILRERAQAPITTTGRLATIVAGAVPTRELGKNPATRTFQAVRMHINRELEELAAALPQALRALAPRGRLAIISFHSLEDRMVKRFLRGAARGDDYPPDMPVRADQLRPPAPGPAARCVQRGRNRAQPAPQPDSCCARPSAPGGRCLVSHSPRRHGAGIRAGGGVRAPPQPHVVRPVADRGPGRDI